MRNVVMPKAPVRTIKSGLCSYLFILDSWKTGDDLYGLQSHCRWLGNVDSH